MVLRFAPGYATLPQLNVEGDYRWQHHHLSNVEPVEKGTPLKNNHFWTK